jgi:hypothetical protein
MIDPEAYDTADEYISAMQKLISDEQNLIVGYNGQIELLNSLKKKSLDTFNTNKGGSGSGGSDDEFQNLMDFWEKRIAANQAKYEQVQNEIDLLEKQGKIAGEGYYRQQIELEKERRALLKGQETDAINQLRALESAGKKGTNEWFR